jgi:hypothetical protein
VDEKVDPTLIVGKKFKSGAVPSAFEGHKIYAVICPYEDGIPS